MQWNNLLVYPRIKREVYNQKKAQHRRSETVLVRYLQKEFIFNCKIRFNFWIIICYHVRFQGFTNKRKNKNQCVF